MILFAVDCWDLEISHMGILTVVQLWEADSMVFVL